jgi:hypothetical protein
MKKLLYASVFAFGTFAFTACDNAGTGTTDRDETVIDRDTVVTEREVQETVIETDTTTRTETIDTDQQRQNQPNTPNN